MQPYRNSTSDYNQRRSSTQRAHSSPHELDESYKGNYRRDSRVNAKNRMDDDDEVSSSNTDVRLRIGRNGYADANGRHRSRLVNEQQQYETDDENNESPTSVQSNSINTHGSSVALTSGEKIVEMNEQNNHSDFNLIPGRRDVYNDFNNNYSDPYKRATNSDDVLMDPTNDYEADYTDRDFPGGGKSARQSIAGENLVLYNERKPRCCCCSRKICVIVTFVVLAVIAVALYFFWPRIPTVSIDGSQTLPLPNTIPSITQQPPTVNLSINVQVLIDNRENWIPYKFNKISVQVYDSASLSTYNGPIATGNVTNYTLQPRAISTLSIPINVFYKASQSNDPTFQDLFGACVKSSAGDGSQSLLNFQVDVTLFIAGIDWIYQPKVSIPVSDFKCPYSLSGL